MYGRPGSHAPLLSDHLFYGKARVGGDKYDFNLHARRPTTEPPRRNFPILVAPIVLILTLIADSVAALEQAATCSGAMNDSTLRPGYAKKYPVAFK